ncbi:hypothetical protein OSB04_018210 [Centaurea solstitialis]|uniref:Integrase catalytic domain-containing protein n=1 Tax=Centaurea solstitialis TaxID=347529 RepID=A0AA38WJ42_9ASTR|nr:hypothetical protein OSB04_018210 [Centaurea solstitialis]
MSNEGQNLLSIPKFDGDYDHWSMLMENLLRSKEWWHLIDPGYKEPAAGTKETDAEKTARAELKIKDLKVKNYLFAAIDKSILKTILQKETSRDLWESMRTKYQGSQKVQRSQLQALRREFEVLEMKESETITDYFGRVMSVANNMRNNGENLQDIQIVEKILRTLTERFNYIVVSIEEAKDIDRLSVDELQSSLIVHEQKFRRKAKDEEHYECPEWENKANFAEFDDNEEVLLMASVDEEKPRKGEVWILDSGCSNHMTSHQEWFSDLDEDFKHTVKLGNDSRIVVAGKGTIRMKVNGITQVISDVYYIPELRSNLLSLGQLQEKGLAILIRDGTCKVYHPTLGVIMHSNTSGNRMFPLLAEMVSPQPTCLQIQSTDEANLWHCRFGHLSYKGLSILSRKGMVEGLPLIHTPRELCSSCLVGKQHRGSFPKKSLWKSTHKLQLVHSDICGPISPTSNSNKRYILSFIDDFTRKTWIYLLSQKSEAFYAFKNFKIAVEKQAGASILCLRTDRGGEFNSNEFSTFCKEHGISRQLTAAYTPQQNGIAERKNRTIMNMVRSMLNAKQMPKEFWAEAANWCIHVLNRSPTAALEEKTPQEAWDGDKPKVDYFRVFGCLANVHVPGQTRTKLEDRSRPHVFIGVSKESKAYRLFDPTTNKVCISRDVDFEENKGWSWKQSAELVTTEALTWGDADDYEDGDEFDEFEAEAEAERESDTGASPKENSGNISEESDAPVRSESATPIAPNERQHKPPIWMSDYTSGEGLSEEEEAVMMIEDDPVTFQEAVKIAKWKEAMEKEMDSIERNGTWELCTLPKNAIAIAVKWLFKTKLNEKGEIEKHKARLVAKGYAQQYGVDYTEVFAPVARLDTIRLILAVAAQKRWEVLQLDVKSAFLQGNLEEKVYVQQPLGFEKRGEEEKVYLLHKALYGLKQAPRAWYSRIEAYFVREGFKKCSCEHTLFTKMKEGGKLLIVSLYVDDLIYTGNDKHMCEDFKLSMMREFDMSDLGKMRYFLGIEVIQNEDGIFICQRKYARELLTRFGMENSNAVENPVVPGTRLFKDEEGLKVDPTMFKQVVGCLMYLTATRPDLMYGVNLISRFMSSPTESHWSAAKRILRYLKGTSEFGIFYSSKVTTDLEAYSDSDYAGDLDDRKSTSGYVFLFGKGAVSWSSKKQPVVSLSSTEAEYISAASCASQCIWLRNVLRELGSIEKGGTVINCDNNSAIQLSKNAVLHGRSRHIDVKFHFIRDLVNKEMVVLKYCNTQDQIADIMTKPIKAEQFRKLREMLGMIEAAKIN